MGDKESKIFESKKITNKKTIINKFKQKSYNNINIINSEKVNSNDKYKYKSKIFKIDSNNLKKQNVQMDIRNVQVNKNSANKSKTLKNEIIKNDIDSITPKETELKNDVDLSDIANDKDFIEHPKPMRPKLKLEL